MLVLSRGPKDKVLFPNLGITVEILRVSGNRVRVGVDAPNDVRILRHELSEHEAAEAQQSSQLAQESGSADDQEAMLPDDMVHRLRNRLNSAHLALSLMEKQLNAGMDDKAFSTLQKAMHELDSLDREVASPAATPVEGDHKKPRALLVEDDANECELLAGYLRMSGFDVDTAEDGLQAMLQLSRRDRPDVVLLDMHMPRMNGKKTIENIRANPDFKGVRVFAVTGTKASEVGVEVGPGGVDRWFRKPIKPQDLVDSLTEDMAVAGH